MSFCAVPSSETKARVLLESIAEWEGDFHLSPCERSSLLARELYERRQDKWGEWEAVLTEKGRRFLAGNPEDAP